jgi:dTDP-4-amino-4,6-dideoxygalactose transaminase
MKESQKMTNYIPFVDLSTQYDAIKSEIDYAINKVLNKGQFILGEYLKTFEKHFAFYCNTKFCIGVSSGTQALHLALKAMDISKGMKLLHRQIPTSQQLSPFLIKEQNLSW